MYNFSSQLQQYHAQLLASKSKCFFFLLRGEFCLLVSFVGVHQLHLSSQTPGPSHLPNSLRTRLITHQLRVVVLSVSLFYHCLVFFTALSLFTYDIVIMWLCKWQLTCWVGVNTAVHSIERRKQVINNSSNLISSIDYCQERLGVL